MVPPTPTGEATISQNNFEDTVEIAGNLIKQIKSPLPELSAVFGSLHLQTSRLALEENVDRREIQDLKTEMHKQDEKHNAGLKEIQVILDELLKSDVIEHMKRMVKQEIDESIDNIVKQQVEECLKRHIPKELQDELASSKRRLDELNIQFHNSESRRMNGNLRINGLNDSLATLLTPTGSISTNYPKDLKGLFSLDEETTNALNAEYGLDDSHGSRVYQLNRFMQHCGVRYQLVE